MTLRISFGSYNGIFALPTDAVDKYIDEASFDDLKVLLYIFRKNEGTVSLEKSCEELSMPEDSFKKSVNFWVKRGLFKCTKLKDEAKPALDKKASQAQTETAEKTAAVKVFGTPIEYAQSEIADKSRKNAEIKFILDSVPDQLGRTISPAECSILVYLYEGVGLPAEVIVMLVGYCVNIGKPHIRYIEQMAIGWAKDGVDTGEKAERRIKDLENNRSLEGKVRSILGISDRALTDNEKKYISAWSTLGTTPELIKLSYEICVARTEKLSFPYMNKILKSWSENGIKTPEEAKNDSRGKRPGKGAKKPSFNIDEYVNLSMKTLHNE